MKEQRNEEFFTNNESSIVTSERILYTASSFARGSLLHLQEIGELTANRTHESSRSNLQSFLFFIVISGSGKLHYDNRDYSLSTGDCVFIDCEKAYSHRTNEPNLWTLRWCHFYGAFLHAIYQKYCERGGRPIFRPKDVNIIIDVWKKLMATAASSDYMRDMLINQHLSELMVCIMSESWHPENQENLPKKKSLMYPVKEYLDKNYRQKITLDGLSEMFFINKYYLAKTFKDQYGQSINSYLLNTRITKAKQLLRFTDKSVESIGIECGLGAAHYFSSKFKEIEGVPPSVYREQW
ncbi:AraC family transcriptional regulator [Butyrivibrio sp. AC2005]|uniref:AraC family transcriptional regulator n=1 Tax=Butyrivibrio sp. AC2005 TaxID=1280672 RepID=UPI000424FCDD|nr:AraC family transcriptional regulator [Butyrivibrio sp. AC2005]